LGIQQLNNLDFAPGIKAAPINANFNLINTWLARERLRTGGWGIVEGFALSFDQDTLSVTVNEGVFINKDGEEVIVDKKVFATGDISYDTIERTYTVDTDGRVVLDDNVYDFENKKYLVYNPPDITVEIDDSILRVRDVDGYPISVVRLLGNILWLNSSFAGSRVTVTQTVAYNRVDTIMLNLDGSYEYLWSIDSPSPSHVDLADYDTSLCVAVLFWQITEEGITCDFFTNHRSYRTVYVNNHNELYINGERYQKQKFIYFVEPPLRDRQENDLWYNSKDNTLYIWRQVDGEWGWTIVNDHSEIVIQERKLWTPDINPDDLQTFLFDPEELNLKYVPGTNSLTIFVDNAVLMHDQYDEIVMTQADVNDLVAQQKELKDKITKAKIVLQTLKRNRDSLEPGIKALKKDLSDSTKLYPDAYDLANEDYTIKDTDLDNLRNLMVIDKRLAHLISDFIDLLSQIENSEKLISVYEQELTTISEVLEATRVNKGAGFKLKKPLLHPAFVAITVTHAVRMKPARETFQRGAVFVKEVNIAAAVTGSNQVFETAAGYTVGQEQLEVYVDGIKLPRSINGFCEIVDTVNPTVDYSYVDDSLVTRYQDTISHHFKVVKNITVGQTITCRISRQVWNYDQLDTLVSNIKAYANSAMSVANSALEQVETLNTNFISNWNDIKDLTDTIQENIADLDNCYKQGTTIALSDIPAQVRTGVISNSFDIIVPITSTVLTVNNVNINDVFSVYYVTADNVRLLIQNGSNRDIQDIDYDIQRLTDTQVKIILRDDLVIPNTKLYVRGFKRGVSSG